MKDIELKDRDVKIKKEIVELFFKSIMDNMDRFEKKEMKKTRAV